MPHLTSQHKPVVETQKMTTTMATPLNMNPAIGTPLRTMTPMLSTTTPKLSVEQTQDQLQQDQEADQWEDTERAVEELRAVELLPLVMDIVEKANDDTLRPQDAENAAGPIKVRITRAREILRNMHGLSETPEEREARVLKLKRNIEVKSTALAQFKELVGERLTLSTEEGPQQMELDGQAQQGDGDVHMVDS